MSSAAVLRTYATLPSPSTSLPPRVLLSHNASTLAIFDAYPKAKYHFLVLPRYPFPSNNDPESTRSICRLSDLDDLRSLLTKTTRDAREQIVGQMAEMAREVEEMIRDEMVKSEGWEWRIDVGFHAIPSLKHLHLHVISDDRLSPALKTKKHYNSFRPDLGFFVSIADVQRWILDDDDTIRERALLGTHSLLASPLTCFKCDEPHHNVPKLKSHLEKEFQEEGRKALARIKKTGRQRTSSEEDMF
ncbi:HIT-like domain-containing protein [Dioszegia hungarica]|uniref:HIT-like domain-containing protein n=1 Tax=Dioszegia hungarica TaxID=4972 RepID=A0AA38H1G5_9TREE|nr:HIT-like domain-containing protein [Dioszegia hungarica]KAI9631972.1 HIT-like domain-containing protein [Dioszegia hungarica]